MQLWGSGKRRVHTVKHSASGGVRLVAADPTQVNVDAELSIDVALTDIGKPEKEPLVKFLNDLLRFATDSIESFADEFR
jgi:hypothetical protein